MRILTLNPGSSTIKAALIEMSENRGDTTETARTIAARSWAATDGRTEEDMLRSVLTQWGRPDAVAVRFVHGGSRPGPVRLTRALLADLNRLVSLAPLHQPQSVRLTEAVLAALPGVAVIGHFDTALHTRLPEPAAHYGLPREWTRQNRLRRYGFHGLSCRYALRRTAQLLGADVAGLQMVCVHIGSGVSVTALHGDRSVDTSMGFTPLEGAVMRTRCGSVDPGLLLHLLGPGGVGVGELSDALYLRSGLAGMTGTNGDLRTVLAARARDDGDAVLAVDVFLHRLRREIGAAAMSLTRLDAITFTGGVAEHQPGLLGELIGGLSVLGACVDPLRLAESGDRRIDGGGVRLLVVGAREDVELARGARELLAGATLAGGLDVRR